jgi:hypothetical protein
MISSNSFSQMNNRDHTRRFGIGFQVFEPTGLRVQSFRGFFNDNNSSFATYGIWELDVGIENILGVVRDKKYSGGNWKGGGLRVDLNYLHPLLTIYAPFVFQTYVGVGIQTGTRKYEASKGVESDFSTGANLMLRVELVTHGIDIGPSIWFFSFYSDLKYHAAFSQPFDYLSPVLGVSLRKGR